jgi:hypothetical protein
MIGEGLGKRICDEENLEMLVWNDDVGLVAQVIQSRIDFLNVTLPFEFVKVLNMLALVQNYFDVRIVEHKEVCNIIHMVERRQRAVSVVL